MLQPSGVSFRVYNHHTQRGSLRGIHPAQQPIKLPAPLPCSQHGPFRYLELFFGYGQISQDLLQHLHEYFVDTFG